MINEILLIQVNISYSANEVEGLVKEMVGHKLITKQTPKEGILVRKVMVAESVDILRETYLCILMDRSVSLVVD